MEVELRKQFSFESAHLLPNVPDDHKCRRLHGHSYRVTLVCKGPCDPEMGWLIDYAEMKEAFQPVWAQLDHHYLNEVEGLENPTSEVLAKWIWDRLEGNLRYLFEVIVHETCTTECRYRGKNA